MDVRHVQAFLAVLDEGTFVGAARRLGLGAATVSERISRLEADLGAALLHRRPVQPTPAGAALEPHARRMVASVDAALAAVAQVRQVRPDVLRIGQVTSGAAVLNAPIHQALARALPGTTVRVVDLTLAEADSALTGHRVDVAFLRHPVDDPRLDVVPLYLTERVAALSARHPLADRPAVTVTDLADVPITAVTRFQNRTTQRAMSLEVERNGDRARILESFTLGEAVVHVLVHGAVAAPSLGSARYLSVAGIRFLPLRDAHPSGPVAVCRRDDHRPAVRTFMDVAAHVAAACRSLIPDALTTGTDAARPVG